MTAIATLPVVLGVGVHGSRPAASAVGKGGLYSCTTHSLVYQTDGSTWSTWATLGSGTSGALILLEQHSASNSATLDFTSFISSTYDDYVIRGVDLVAATNGQDLLMRVASTGPSYDAANNYYGGATGFGNIGTFTHSYNTSGFEIIRVLANGATGNYAVARFDLQFTNPNNTTLAQGLHGTAQWHNGTQTLVAAVGGVYFNASPFAVVAVRFLMTSGNITSGTIRIYGVAK